MKLTPNLLFPTLKFKQINLNNQVRDNIDHVLRNHPVYTQKLINKLNANGFITYGGYGENRKDIWKGTYMDVDKTYIHVGIDINVPYNTPIVLPFDVTVIDSRTFDDLDVGWGSRVILSTNNPSNPLILLGHLNKDIPPVGTIIKTNSVIATVGTFPNNGNVFEHLHLQLINPTLKYDPLTLDGYTKEHEPENYPDPFNTNFIIQ